MKGNYETNQHQRVRITIKASAAFVVLLTAVSIWITACKLLELEDSYKVWVCADFSQALGLCQKVQHKDVLGHISPALPDMLISQCSFLCVQNIPNRILLYLHLQEML